MVCKTSVRKCCCLYFFVLSGYLMFEAANSWYRKRCFKFIINRYLRITPPFLIAAFFSIFIHYYFSFSEYKLISIEIIPSDYLSIENSTLSVLEAIFPFNYFFIHGLNMLDGISYHFVRYSWAIATELIFYWAIFMFVAVNSIWEKEHSLNLLFLFGLLITLIGFLSNKNLYPETTNHFFLAIMAFSMEPSFYGWNIYFYYIFKFL